MSRPVIITCALTGGADSAGASPHIPVTPEQIAREALAARQAGAAIVHIHVRHPETGKPSRDPALYREVVRLIRAANSDVLINLTTGPGAGFHPGEDPNVNAVSRGMATPEERVAHVLELKPDICSLDVATMNFGPRAFVNVPAHLERMAEMIRASGSKPELEVFDLGHARLAADMAKRGLFEAPPWFQLCLGIPWGAPATPEAMLALKALVPEGAVWSGFGISRMQFPMVAQAVILGGHVRVGLEDNLYIARGQLSPGNAPLVERAVTIVEALGERVATPAEARELLRLRPQ
ncbi:MAG: 3-keto-5-aminohexanoate cleavage protein [Acetobacteraceae bacterium]|nr:3-keto-5-aminohexanoate cleavage protein [Acetobacteraceae bacterium]